MKHNSRRLRNILNFLAFNLLFFALYLNFVRKEPSAETISAMQASTSAITPVHSKIGSNLANTTSKVMVNAGKVLAH